MNRENSFDRLVSGLGKDERLTLLDKLSSATQQAQQAEKAEAPDFSDNSQEETDIQIKFRNESIFLKIWLFLKSIFSGTSQKIIYNELIVSRKAKNLSKKFPDIYDFKKKSLLTDFFIELKNLHQAVDFYKSGITAYEESTGEAYVFLGSLFLSDLYEKIDTEISPYSLDFSKNPSQELKNSLLRKLEDLLSGIPAQERQVLYANVQSLEWIRKLVKLPYEKFLSRFSSFNHTSFFCPLDNAVTEINQFAKVICHSKKITPEVIETLFMLNNGFSVETNKPSDNSETKSMDFTQEYQQKYSDSITKINSFIKKIPLKTIAAVASNDAEWVLPNPSGVEDWFVKFKSQWKKQFERKWESWLTDRKKEEIRFSCEKVFGQKKLPLLEHRPWKDAWGGIPCARDYTLGFLYNFFLNIYPQIATVLKIIQLEGDFVLREVRVEFTNSYNDFSNQEQSIISLNAKLAEDGDYFETFKNITTEKLRTIQNQSRMDSLMLSIETEVSMLASKFGITCREFINILEGILKIKMDAKQETITNLAMIQGIDNPNFRINLQNAYTKLVESLDLLKELETIESSTSLTPGE